MDDHDYHRSTDRGDGYYTVPWTPYERLEPRKMCRGRRSMTTSRSVVGWVVGAVTELRSLRKCEPVIVCFSLL